MAYENTDNLALRDVRIQRKRKALLENNLQDSHGDEKQ